MNPDTLWGCDPNERECDYDRVVQCNVDGDGWDLVADCTAFGTVCLDGVCVGLSPDVRTPTDTLAPPDTAPDLQPADSLPDLSPVDVAVDGDGEDSWESSYGYLEYTKIPNLEFTGDLIDVAWRPNGVDALILSQGGDLIHYDPDTQTLSSLVDLDGSPSRIAWQPDGNFAYITGRNGDVPKLWRYTPDAGVTVEPFIDLGGLRLQSVQFDPADGRAVVTGFTEAPLISRIYLVAPPYDAVTAQQAWGGYPGITDAVFARPDPLVFDGAEFILTSEGWSGADSRVWLTTQDLIIENGWMNSFGNPGRATWHPDRPLALLVGTSSNILYLFDAGTWDKVYTQDTGPNLSGFAWNPDGTRGLITGRTVGNPLKGTVVEYRLLEGMPSTGGSFIDQSIPGFGSGPYSANSNSYLHAVAFRPGTSCEEGLIVGSDNGSAWSPTFGLAIRFEDPSNPDCGGITED